MIRRQRLKSQPPSVTGIAALTLSPVVNFNGVYGVQDDTRTVFVDEFLQAATDNNSIPDKPPSMSLRGAMVVHDIDSKEERDAVQWLRVWRYRSTLWAETTEPEWDSGKWPIYKNCTPAIGVGGRLASLIYSFDGGSKITSFVLSTSDASWQFEIGGDHLRGSLSVQPWTVDTQSFIEEARVKNMRKALSKRSDALSVRIKTKGVWLMTNQKSDDGVRLNVILLGVGRRAGETLLDPVRVRGREGQKTNDPRAPLDMEITVTEIRVVRKLKPRAGSGLRNRLRGILPIGDETTPASSSLNKVAPLPTLQLALHRMQKSLVYWGRSGSKSDASLAFKHVIDLKFDAEGLGTALARIKQYGEEDGSVDPVRITPDRQILVPGDGGVPLLLTMHYHIYDRSGGGKSEIRHTHFDSNDVQFMIPALVKAAPYKRHFTVVSDAKLGGNLHRYLVISFVLSPEGRLYLESLMFIPASLMATQVVPPVGAHWHDERTGYIVDAGAEQEEEEEFDETTSR